MGQRMTLSVKIPSAVIIAYCVVFSGCVNLGQDSLDNGANDIVCNPPYLRIGDSCCLDKDGNGICDKDEQSTTTTLKPMVSTTTTVAPSPPSTTVLAAVTSTQPLTKCNTNADCGGPVNYTKCSDGKVIMYSETPICTHPGTPEAKCTMKSKTSPYEACVEGERCVGGRCVNESRISCGDACLEKGLNVSYCHTTASCLSGGKRAEAGDIQCSQGAVDGYCCCKSNPVNNTLDEDTSTTSSSTTTTLKGLELDPLLVRKCGSATPPACAGICPLGMDCKVKYIPGPHGSKIPGSCACQATTTTTTLPPCHYELHQTLEGIYISYCGGYCPAGSICTLSPDEKCGCK